MSTPLPRPASMDGLFVWVMHRFAEVFEEHAILKGGIALRLFDCPRSTTDIDYVFVPFRSKADIRDRIESVLAELEDAELAVTTHSKMLRATLRLDSAAIQIEADVGLECPARAVPTGGFAAAQGLPSQIVRVMDFDCALAHKLAAWNERRLLRDLYDTYFLASRLGATPDPRILDERLGKIESRLTRLKRQKQMTRAQLAAELRAALEELDQLGEGGFQDELAPILPPGELIGLQPRIRSAVIRIAERLEDRG